VLSEEITALISEKTIVIAGAVKNLRLVNLK